MKTYEWQVGEVKLTVEAPEGVNVAGAQVWIKPEDREAFLAAADAAGGLDNLWMPAEDRGYAMSASAKSEDGRAKVFIEEPPREMQDVEPPHPFFGPLRERIARECAASEDEGRKERRS